MKKTTIQIILTAGLLWLFSPCVLPAQTLKVMGWNILSFEGVNNVVGFNVQPFVDFITQENPDIICFNEFETGTSRMNWIEKLTEVAHLVGMYPFFGVSYSKDVGYYGNGILSKYPYINTYSSLIVKPSGSADQRSVEYIDILVPTPEKPEGVEIRIACTHLDHQGGQLEQARDVKTKTIKDSSIPTLLLGDLNQGTTSSTVSTFTNGNTYGGACNRVCDNTYTYKSSTNATSKLDYFFSYPAGAWTTVSYKVVTTATGISGGFTLSQMSDHYPYIGVVKLNN